MDRGPRWTLRLAALFLGSAPMAHHLLSPVRWKRFEPFSDLRVIETMFESAPLAWLLCWVLPFAASFPSWRSEAWTSGFTYSSTHSSV